MIKRPWAHLPRQDGWPHSRLRDLPAESQGVTVALRLRPTLLSPATLQPVLPQVAADR